MMRAILILMMLAGGTALVPETLAAQPRTRGIMVSGAGDMEFGRIRRPYGGEPARYEDVSPAQFSVTGEKGSSVRLVVALPGRNFRDGFSLDVAGRDCRYSTDGGVTWRSFSSGALSQDTRFPADATPGSLSTIYVQIRGTATVMKTSGLRRGDYSTTLRLTATYLDTPDGLID